MRFDALVDGERQVLRPALALHRLVGEAVGRLRVLEPGAGERLGELLLLEEVHHERLLRLQVLAIRERVGAVGVGEDAETEAAGVRDGGARRRFGVGERAGVRQPELVQNARRRGDAGRPAVEAVVVRGRDEPDARPLQSLGVGARRVEAPLLVREVGAVRGEGRLEVGDDEVRLREQVAQRREDGAEVVAAVRRLPLEHGRVAERVAEEGDAAHFAVSAVGTGFPGVRSNVRAGSVAAPG